MKQFLSLAAALLLAGTCGISVLASDTAEVYVTIADGDGNLALAQQAVTVTDTDADGVLTINDALAAAHEAHYDGGAAAGYDSGMTEYGISMNRLWGTDNGGSYGYCVNNASAWNLLDPVTDGDFISAYAYTDLTGWSDTFGFFDVQTVDAVVGNTVTLTLSAAGYDAEFNPITVPVANAVITVNGEATSYTTDEEGRVTVTLDQTGTLVISAVSDSMTLVPPVCVAAVSEPAPRTADNGGLIPAAVSMGLLAAAVVSGKKVYEK